MIHVSFETVIESAGIKTRMLGYRGFPKSSCISPNHVVCHGIPKEKILREGDIINVDVTALKDGWHGDTSRMFFVGEVSLKAKKLVKTTYESMMKSINILKDGVHVGDIGSTIQGYVESKGFSVVRDFCGHGIGKNFHEQPGRCVFLSIDRVLARTSCSRRRSQEGFHHHPHR